MADNNQNKNPQRTQEKKISKPRIQIPDDIAYFLEYEDCSKFNTERYYVMEDIAHLLDTIKARKKVGDKIRAYGIDFINTTMFYGETGTGKTTAAKYIAHELGLDFFYVNFAKLIEGGMGGTAKNICKIFEFVAGVECLFMLDEIDCVAVRRSTANGANSGEMIRITITIMQELDHLKATNTNSVIIGASNREDMLDEALLSRFAVKYAIKQISIYDKQNYIKRFINNINKQAKANGEPLVDLDEGNLHYYITNTADITMRGIESDIITALSAWIENGCEDFYLEHISSGLQAI